ncbi:hypothetical protein [Yoonia sp. R2-816]|uniref:hypothetical protein n=1 Tax=Yoonia sp. R2-816 TaxID=3342638 RepID=UPI00372D7616
MAGVKDPPRMCPFDAGIDRSTRQAAILFSPVRIFSKMQGVPSSWDTLASRPIPCSNR